MTVRLNITMDEAVFAGLEREVRPKKMSVFITRGRPGLADPRPARARRGVSGRGQGAVAPTLGRRLASHRHRSLARLSVGRRVAATSSG